MRDTNTKPHKTKSKLGLRPTAKCQEHRKEIIMTNTNSSSNTTRTATFFACDHIGKRIYGSVANFKKAETIDTPQYKALMELMGRHATYTLDAIAPEFQKQSYKGLNFEMMKDYVEFKGSVVQKAEFDEIVNSNAAFPVIKSWFVENFKVGFTVEKAKSEIAAAKRKMAQATLKATKANVRKVVKAKMVKAVEAKASTPIDAQNVINF